MWPAARVYKFESLYEILISFCDTVISVLQQLTCGLLYVSCWGKPIVLLLTGNELISSRSQPLCLDIWWREPLTPHNFGPLRSRIPAIRHYSSSSDYFPFYVHATTSTYGIPTTFAFFKSSTCA